MKEPLKLVGLHRLGAQWESVTMRGLIRLGELC
jgi:hypothetical protein